jgi:hypothetical protein
LSRRIWFSYIKRPDDGDGVADVNVSHVFGLASLKGCPDTDKDGVADKDDKCTVAGPKENAGCPFLILMETEF